MTTAFKNIAPLLSTPAFRALNVFLGELEKEFTAFAGERRGFLSQLTGYALTGAGKRVRPALVFVASGFGEAPPDAVRQTAAAVEMIHIATLVHDDIVDEAAIRRQKPTVFVKYGEGAAVLLGDYVYAQAFQRLAAVGNGALLGLFADTTAVMCDGEIGQLERRFFFDLSEEEYLGFLDKKTASLMAASCRAGAMLAGLPAAQQQALDDFGRRVGIAFQIIDDILDLEGEEAVTGKTLRTDLTHGKMTLPLIHFSQQLKAGERARLFEELKSPNGHLAALIRRVHDAGSIDYSRAKAAALLAQAGESLARLPDGPSRRLLADIAERLSHRQS